MYPNGFQPVPGKKYLFNAWVKDNDPNNKSISIVINVNSVPITLKCKAIVEGWKLIEGVIDLTGPDYTLSSSDAKFSSSLNITITRGASVDSHVSVYLDDIRMHPADSQMKTYAYDEKTLRLVAELDENCMATFYEYDDEGLLVRVKKETERGVVTLKESRSSYKKQP